MIRNIQRKMRKARGFTLVELMIVVAIIGILAALAIYGVRKYMTNAKTGEVKNVVGRIAKDASTAFNREKLSTTVVMTDTATSAISNTLCLASNTIPANLSQVAGKKYQSAASAWDHASATESWQCLKFSLAEPQYYRYQYNRPDATNFSAVGTGDLDGDNTASTFTMSGQVSGGGVKLSPTIAESNPDE